MKILWFSLSPCGSLRRHNKSRLIQGWMISLEDVIKKEPDIELSVAYFSDIKEDPFEYDRVMYYPMGERSDSKLQRVINRFVGKEEQERIKLGWMKEVVNNCNPDIIHIHGTEQCFGSIAKHFPKIPVIYSLQGLVAPISEKFFSGFTESQIRSYKGIWASLRGVSISRLYKEFCLRGEREITYLKDAKYILGRTEWDKSISTMLNPNANYYTVNEILRQPFFHKVWEKKAFSNKPVFITILSSSQIYKGYETLIKTARLLKLYTDIDFEWKVVGYSKTDWLQDLGHKVTKTTPEGCNICLCGSVEAKDLAEMMSNADLYIHTSHIENSPNSVCEAMCVGLPVIATNVGGTSSMTKDSCVLVPDGDPYFLAAMIKKVLANFDLAKMHSKKARQIAIARHNADSVRNELITVYRTVLK